MHLSINRISLIYSAAGVLAATAITASVLARFFLLRRREASRTDAKVGVPGEPSVVEELVTHNWKGF